MATPAFTHRVSEDLPSWQLQDAKNRFSAVVKAAAEGPAQLVTVHGVPAAVVMSPRDYERLCRAGFPAGKLSDALRSPLLDDADDLLFERDQHANPARDLAL